MIVVLHPFINLLVADSIIALQLSLESYFEFPSSTLIEVRRLQPEKAPSPIVVTEFGIVTEVREEQPLKASLPIVMRELGKVTEIKELQLRKASSPIVVTEFGIVTEDR